MISDVSRWLVLLPHDRPVRRTRRRRRPRRPSMTPLRRWRAKPRPKRVNSPRRRRGKWPWNAMECHGCILVGHGFQWQLQCWAETNRNNIYVYIYKNIVIYCHMLTSLAQNMDRLQPISLKRCGREVPFKLSYAVLPHIQSVWSRCWGPTIVVALVLLSVAEKVLRCDMGLDSAWCRDISPEIIWGLQQLLSELQRNPRRTWCNSAGSCRAVRFFPPSIHLSNRTNATCLNQARARAAGCSNQCSWN